MRSIVQTVLGPIPVAQLGRTLIHEHLYIAFPGAELENDGFNRRAFVDDAVRRLKDLAALGVKSLVDPCPIELGRDPELMAEVSQRSGINVICTTGFYFEELGLPIYWRYRSAEEIAELYIREIEFGIGNTGIRPGAIKAASGKPAISAQEEKFLAAAAMASKQTGLPIITHTEDGCCGPEQQTLFARHGAHLHQCLIGHSCGNPDPAYHRRIVEGGTYIGFDRIGAPMFVKDAVRADNVKQLVDSGYASRLLLSQDRACLTRGKPFHPLPAKIRPKIEALKRAGNWPAPQTYLFTDFLPMLRQRGIDEATITSVLDENPRRFFAGETLAN
jgi:phosphotriesterase-related protein